MAAETGWEHFEAAADVGVRAWAPDRTGAFAQSARGVFALIVEPSTVADIERREVRAQGATPEALLANWIGEGLYVQEIEGFAVHTVEVTVCDGALVHGFLRGEPLDQTRHRVATVKTPTLREVSVLEAEGRVEATLVVAV